MNYLSYFKNDAQIKECISKKVLKIRHDNKLTQEQLAEMLDVSIEHISRIGNCKYTCSISFIFKLCSIFKMDINDFFDIKSNSKNNNVLDFLDSLTLEQYKAIVEFCDEIKKYYTSK